MTTRLSHPWYNLVDAIHACYNLVFSVWGADQVTVRGVQVVYRKKDKADVRILQSSDEQMRILEMWSGHFGVKKLVCHTGEDDH